uniref:Uncharacterized protein n=1 Tax=Tanacetum cinerariifolium TaxID=118510 RepID=A0A699KLI3_TANCI|nr:hypothetical protein [Tanacetum cinerariifolium]
MSDSAFRKRFRSSYDSSPSPALPVRKRYRGTSELILSTDSEGDEKVEESSNYDRESEDAKDEGPMAEDGDPAAGDEGLATGDEGHGIGVESRGLDDESRGLSGGFGLGEKEEAEPEGQQRAVSVVGTVASEPLGLGYGALRRQELALEVDHVYTPYIVPSPISSSMMLLTVPSPVASPVATPTATITVDKDQFIERGKGMGEKFNHLKMIGCKMTRTLASVEIEIILILGLPCCLSSSSVRCLESISKNFIGSDD